MTQDLIEQSIEWHKKRHGDHHTTRVLEQTVEEMAELIVEIQKRIRSKADGGGGGERIDEIASEMGDVVLCFAHVADALGIGDVVRQNAEEAANNLIFNCRFELSHPE